MAAHLEKGPREERDSRKSANNLAIGKIRGNITGATHDRKSYRLDELARADIIRFGDILCGYLQHPEIKSLGPQGTKCTASTRGLLRRMAINGGLQHCIGKEVSRFEQGKDDFIENIAFIMTAVGLALTRA